MELDVVLSFGRRADDDDDDDDIEEEEEELDFILFKGALNGNNPDLSENGRLVDAGLLPAKKMISEALSRRADTIRIDPRGKFAAVSMLVDGINFPVAKMPPQAANAVVQMLKLLAGLDIKNKTKFQSGGINAEFDEVDHEIRVDSTPVKGGGERLLVRVQNVKEKLETPKDLGFSDELQAKIREIARQQIGAHAGGRDSHVRRDDTRACDGPRIDAYMYSIGSIAELYGRDLPHIQEVEQNEGRRSGDDRQNGRNEQILMSSMSIL